MSRRMSWNRLVFFTSIFATATAVQAAEASVTLHHVTAQGEGKAVGEVRLQDSAAGLLVATDLQGLAPGPYAVHIHEHPDCGPARMHGNTVPAGAAGGHFDPAGTGRHEGPYGEGHLGDLPVMIAEQDGRVSIPVLAPRLKVRDVRDRSLMIHAGVDRYAHHAAHHHGMGGARMYCGIIGNP